MTVHGLYKYEGHMKNILALTLVLLTSISAFCDETTKQFEESTLKALPETTTPHEKAKVVQVLKSSRDAEPEVDTIEGEYSFDCKTWMKASPNGSDSIGDKPFFTRSLEKGNAAKPLGLYTDSDRTLVMGTEKGFQVIAIIPEGFVALTSTAIIYQDIKTAELLPGMSGLIQGIVLFGTIPDLVQTVNFSQSEGNPRILRLITDAKGKKYAFGCSLKDGCHLTSDGINYDLNPGGNGRKILRDTQSLSPKILASVDSRCRLAGDKSFQDKMKDRIGKLSMCPAFKGKKMERPDFSQFDSACSKWRTQFRRQLEALR